MSVPSSSTPVDNVPWEKLAADARLAVASALDSHLASTVPQLDRAPAAFRTSAKVTDNVKQLLSEPQTTSHPRPPPAAMDVSTRPRRASTDSHDTITYTPATHRVSKAKKGKRVHACQFPGCTKVFTRAEHRRRHELNHNPQASFVCDVEGCGKGFHRSDLLARHLEKHDWDPRSPPNSPAKKGCQRHRSQTAPSTVPEPAGATMMLTPTPTPMRTQSLKATQPPTTSTAAPSLDSVFPVSHPRYGSSVEVNDLSVQWCPSSAGGASEKIAGPTIDRVPPYPEDLPSYLPSDRSVTPLLDGNNSRRPSQLPAAERTPESLSGSSVAGSPPPFTNTAFSDIQAFEPILRSSDQYPINFDNDDIQAMYQLQFPQAYWADMGSLQCGGAGHQPAPEVFQTAFSG